MDDYQEILHRLNQMPPDEFDRVIEDPAVMAFLKATSCEDSHDGEHHFPWHIQKEEESENCVCCGLTKRQITARLWKALWGAVTPLNDQFEVPIAPIGKFPKPGNPK